MQFRWRRFQTPFSDDAIGFRVETVHLYSLANFTGSLPTDQRSKENLEQHAGAQLHAREVQGPGPSTHDQSDL